MNAVNFRGNAASRSRLLKLGASIMCLASVAGCGSKLRPEVTEHVQAGTKTIDSPQSISLPMVGEADVPTVEVFLNGRGPYRFLIDLGGNVVSVRQDVAKEAGLAVVQELTKRAVVSGDVRMGKTVFRDVYLVREPEFDVQGVIGFNLFRDGLVVLDYPARRFDWKAGSLPAADGKTITDYELRDRMPYARARIGDRVVWANLDTGARPQLILPADWEDKVRTDGPARTGRKMWNQAEGNYTAREATLAGALAIGSATIAAHPTVTFSPVLEGEVLIGSGSLLGSRITLDTKSRRLKVEGPKKVLPRSVPD